MRNYQKAISGLQSNKHKIISASFSIPFFFSFNIFFGFVNVHIETPKLNTSLYDHHVSILYSFKKILRLNTYVFICVYFVFVCVIFLFFLQFLTKGFRVKDKCVCYLNDSKKEVKLLINRFDEMLFEWTFTFSVLNLFSFWVLRF